MHEICGDRLKGRRCRTDADVVEARADARTTLLLLAVATAAMLALTLLSPLGTDYAADTRPAIEALLAGDLAAFTAHQPSMGPLSLWLRWPFAEIVHLAGGGDLAVYRAGAFACLLVPALLIAVLGRSMASAGARPAAAVLAVSLLALSPVTYRALALGHPEEPLAAALCVAAVLLACARRHREAGLAVGLAVATKQWALLAVLPVVLCVPRRRDVVVRLLLPAGIVTVAAYVPMLLADPAAFIDALRRPVGGLSAMRPVNVWHLTVTEARTVPIGGGEFARSQLVPDWLRTVAHPGVAVLAVAVSSACWRRLGAATLTVRGALLLVALILLLRCWLDPWNHGYYHLPMLLALGAYEVLDRRRAPVLAASGGALVWLLFAHLAGPYSGAFADLLYLAWAIPLTAWLALAVRREADAATITGWTRRAPGTLTPIRDPSPAPTRSAA